MNNKTSAVTDSPTVARIKASDIKKLGFYSRTNGKEWALYRVGSLEIVARGFKTQQEAFNAIPVASVSPWYAALQRDTKQYIVFQSRAKPTETTHPAYAFCFGPYKTQKQAANVAQYQSYGNAKRVTISNSDG